MVHNFQNTNSVVSRFVAELRDVHIQKDRMRFRRNLERIAEVFAYEISRTLAYKETETETPLGIAKVQTCIDRIIVANILRAGMPMHNGMLHYFDQADSAFVSAYRRHHKDGSFDINLQNVSCPDLQDATIVICDPMLATGASIDAALKSLLEHGTPKKIHVVTAIASRPGLDYIRRIYSNATIWTGAIDEELTAKSYIVPGLGDAGDLSFGPKVQS